MSDTDCLNLSHLVECLLTVGVEHRVVLKHDQALVTGQPRYLQLPDGGLGKVLFLTPRGSFTWLSCKHGAQELEID